MPRVVPGAAVESIQGKLGGSTFRQTRSGMLLGRTRRPTQHKSAAEAAIKRNLNEITGRWNTLSQLQQDAWGKFASMLPGALSGASVFVRHNVRLLNANNATLTWRNMPPAEPSTPDFVRGLSPTNQNGSITITWTAPNSAWAWVQIQWSIQVAFSMRGKRRWVLLPAVRSNLLTASQTYTIPAGYTMYFRARSIDNSGRVSPWTSIEPTAAAIPPTPPAVLFRSTSGTLMRFGLSAAVYDVGNGRTQWAGSPNRNLITAPDGDLYVCIRRTDANEGLELHISQDAGESWASCGTYDTNPSYHFVWPCESADSDSHIHIGYICRPTSQDQYFPRYVEWDGGAFVNGKTDFMGAGDAAGNSQTNPGIAVNDSDVVCFVYTKAGSLVTWRETRSKVLISGVWSANHTLVDQFNDEGDADNRRQSASVVPVNGAFHAFTHTTKTGKDVWHFSCDSGSGWDWTKESIAVFGFAIESAGDLNTSQTYQAVAYGSTIHVAAIRESDGNVVYREYTDSWDAVEVVDSGAGNDRVSIGLSGDRPVIAFYNNSGHLVVMLKTGGAWTLFDTFTSGVANTNTPDVLSA